jgi:hypothetical protein
LNEEINKQFNVKFETKNNLPIITFPFDIEKPSQRQIEVLIEDLVISEFDTNDKVYSYKQLSIMQNNLDNISITNDTIDNELKLLKLSIENVNILNNKLSTENDKLRIENNELLSLKDFLLIEYEKLNNVVNEINNLNN